MINSYKLWYFLIENLLEIMDICDIVDLIVLQPFIYFYYFVIVWLEIKRQYDFTAVSDYQSYELVITNCKKFCKYLLCYQAFYTYDICTIYRLDFLCKTLDCTVSTFCFGSLWPLAPYFTTNFNLTSPHTIFYALCA